MTDREMLFALYRAVEILYEKTVGEQLIVSISVNDGQDTLSIKSTGTFIPLSQSHKVPVELPNR